MINFSFDLRPTGEHQRRAARVWGINPRIDQARYRKTAPTRCTGMGWFGGRSDSVETVEGAQEVVSRVSSDLAKKKDTVKSLWRAGVAKATTPSTRVRVRAGKRP